MELERGEDRDALVLGEIRCRTLTYDLRTALRSMKHGSLVAAFALLYLVVAHADQNGEAKTAKA